MAGRSLTDGDIVCGLAPVALDGEGQGVTDGGSSDGVADAGDSGDGSRADGHDDVAPLDACIVGGSILHDLDDDDAVFGVKVELPGQPLGHVHDVEANPRLLFGGGGFGGAITLGCRDARAPTVVGDRREGENGGGHNES